MRPVRAAAVALDPAMTVADALQAIGRASFLHLRRNEAAALAGNAEGVHQMRVASRRIETAIAAFKKTLPREQRKRVQDHLDRLDETLGAARNLDVFASDLLAPARAALPAEPSLEPLAAAVEAARQAAQGRIRKLVLSPCYADAAASLLRSFEGCRESADASARPDPLSEAIGEVAPRLLDRARAKLAKRGKNFPGASAKKRHKLRIAVKKLRYTAELLSVLFDRQAVAKFCKPLKALQNDLGYANDVEVARKVLKELSGDCADAERIAALGARALGWHEKRLAESARKVEKQLRRLRRAEPYWKAAAAPSAPRSTG